MGDNTYNIYNENDGKKDLCRKEGVINLKSFFFLVGPPASIF